MRKARLRRDWSQEDLARETGHSLGNVGRWERGDHKPPGDAVVTIARATGHEIEFFYVEGGTEDDEEEAAETMVRDLTEGIRALVRSEIQRASA